MGRGTVPVTHRKTVSWTRTEDGNHDLSINLSTFKLILSTIAGVATAVTATISLSAMLLKPIAAKWIRDQVHAEMVPLLEAEAKNTAWRVEHRAQYEAGLSSMAAYENRSKQEREEILRRLESVQQRVDDIYRTLAQRR